MCIFKSINKKKKGVSIGYIRYLIHYTLGNYLLSLMVNVAYN